MSITIGHMTIPLSSIVLVQCTTSSDPESKEPYNLYINLKHSFYDAIYDEQKNYIKFSFKNNEDRQKSLTRFREDLNLYQLTEKHRNNIIAKMSEDYCS